MTRKNIPNKFTTELYVEKTAKAIKKLVVMLTIHPNGDIGTIYQATYWHYSKCIWKKHETRDLEQAMKYFNQFP